MGADLLLASGFSSPSERVADRWIFDDFDLGIGWNPRQGPFPKSSHHHVISTLKPKESPLKSKRQDT
jgi:hypothetical protein